MKKMMFTLLVSSLIVASIVSTCFAKEFKDTQGHWGASYISQLADKNIISGDPDGNFRPNDNIKVVEFTKLVLLAAEIPLENTGKGWQSDVLATAEKHDLFEDGEYTEQSVMGSVYRAQMAKIVCAALKDPAACSDAAFSDAASTESKYLPFIYSIKKLGIMNGDENGNFRPLSYATRAEASKVIINLIKAKASLAAPTTGTGVTISGTGTTTTGTGATTTGTGAATTGTGAATTGTGVAKN